MSSLKHALTRATAVALGVMMFTTATAGPATATAEESFSTNQSVTYLPPVAIGGSGGYVNVVVEGWFSNIPFIDPSLIWHESSNLWVLGSETYTKPDGLVYRQIRYTSGNNLCLSHMPVSGTTEGLLITEPCVWSNNSHWWAVDHRYLYTPPCAPTSWPFCPLPVYTDLLVPWDAGDRAAMVTDSIIRLKPRVGSTGSLAQHFAIAPIPKLPR